jgi:hypothetical protein
MKIRLGFAWSAVALLSLGGSSVFAADPYGSASMLPLPSVNAPAASVARANTYGQPAGQGTWAGYNADEEVAPPPANVDGDYNAALQDNGWGDSAGCADGSCCADNCNSCGYWFGGVYGLLMTRDRENNLGLGYVTVGNQVLHSRDAEIGWGGGYEVRLGHMCCDCCGASGWEVVYWSMPQTSGYAQATQDEFGAVIQSDLSMNNLNFGGDNATDWFDNADIASVRIQNTFYNLELNLLSVQSSGSRMSFGAALGARWFRFDENFLYGVDVDTTSDDPTESAFYSIDMTNDLVGAQLGFLANYAATCRFSLFSEVKMGVYANYIQQSQLISQGDGTVATINNGPNAGQAWDFQSNKTDVAFLGELRLGGRFQITQNWSATAAYRAVALTGVAFTTEQVPVNMGDIEGAQNIDSNGSMILHGIQVGAEYRF